jgi:hypothetical protein
LAWAATLESSIESDECSLRIRSAAVQLELARLHQSEADATPSLFFGRFKSTLEVSRFVLDLVGRINASVLRERARLGTDECCARAMYALALANAQLAFSMIGTDPDLVSFCSEGSRAGSEEVRASCRMLALLLGVETNTAPALDDNTGIVGSKDALSWLDIARTIELVEKLDSRLSTLLVYVDVVLALRAGVDPRALRLTLALVINALRSARRQIVHMTCANHDSSEEALIHG